MGTNFYARVIPAKKHKEELKKCIDDDLFTRLKSEIEYTYGEFEPTSLGDEVHGVIHLGKRSGGWKFLWDPNMFIIKNGHYDENLKKYVMDESSVYYVYPLTKKGIKEFIDRDDIEVYDEYDEKMDKEEFFKEALEWVTWQGKDAYDSSTYEKEHPNENKFILNNEYTKMIEKEGYKFTSETHSDFYSDGLRFASFNNFA